MGSVDREQLEQPIQFEEFMTHAAAIFDEVAAGRQVVVQRDGQLVRLTPERRRGKRTSHRFSATDPLLDITGAGRSAGPTNTSASKHAYLADATADHRASGQS